MAGAAGGHDGGVDEPQVTAALAAFRDASEPVRDAVAALLTAVALVLLGAPVGLLWAGVAPRVQVVLGEEVPRLVDPETGAFVAADLAFAALVLGAGLVCGLLALAPVAHPYGPGVVVGLLLGGLGAAVAAYRTGEQVGLTAFQAALGERGAVRTVDATVQLLALETTVLWPVGALTAFAVGTWLRSDDVAGTVSSG